MFASFSSMHHNCSTFAFAAEAAASFCAIFLLGSVILTGPIFVILIQILVLIRIVTGTAATAW